MTAVRNLLQDLAGIGATICPAGEHLILRAGPSAPIPADLVRRIRAAKSELLAVLAAGNEDERAVIEWLNHHPAPSPPGRCAWCRSAETASAVVLPFGTEPGTHTWLHSECWPEWSRARRAEAIAALNAHDHDAVRSR